MSGVSEAKSTPDNTGRKDDTGKAPIALIPHVAMVEEAKAFEDGRKKYGTWNYMRGMAALRLMSAVFRHEWAWLWGELRAPDSGVHHLGHARAGLAMIMQLEEYGKLIDDRYTVPSVEQPAVEVKASRPKLEVGRTYKNGYGSAVTILSYKESSDNFWNNAMHPYIADNGSAYHEFGYFMYGASSAADLILDTPSPAEG